MLQWLYTCVASVCFKYFNCLKCILQVFHLDAAYVAVAIHVCCKCVFQMLQLFHLDVACFHLDVTYVAVAIRVCYKCTFQMFHLFQTMLQVFYLDIICCSGYTHVLQTYVLIVLPGFSML